MKHMLNTLYITQPKSFLCKEGETVVVKQEEKKIVQIPIHTLGQIVCFGFEIVITPALMELCAEKGVGIAWLSDSGKFLGRVEGAIKGNVLLRRAQYRWAEDPVKSLGVAKCMVAAKINNSRINLLRFLRNQPNYEPQEKIRESIDQLARLLVDIERCSDMEHLRGIEGEAAGYYFGVFDHLIVQQKEAFRFVKRTKRPPLDRVNALLSFIYTLLLFDIRSALETVGLDPYVGFLHVDRPGRPSLALDLMEEFRAPFADRLVLSLINLRQIQREHFMMHETGEVELEKDARKNVIIAYQNRKKECIQHPFLGEKMEIGLVFHTQAQLLARHIRGDLSFYPAMIWK